MTSYFENRTKKNEESKKNEQVFKKFCESVFLDKSLKIEEEELKKFQQLRKIEMDDYEFRKKIFWPLLGLNVLGYDQMITVPMTSNNRTRLVINLFIALPLSAIINSGVLFYKEKFESHEYAFSLCEKYHACQIEPENVS